ncbi:MAG: hypothetical protein BM555_05070 [Crocinitomix sp. MedPE-SWsnd]|nr:MAG: hypothetical protein BM555_05070 [Crocinitomix sp. MedPE-SWsnd]
MKNNYINKIFYSALLLGIGTFAKAQQNDFEWALSTGETSNNDFAKAVTVDLSGNVYTTGKYSGTVDFDPGTGVSTLTSNGTGDVFLQKLDADGNFLWAKGFGGSSAADQGLAITTDSLGVYLCGIFKNATDFDPGAGTTTLTPSGTSTEAFIVKFDTLGNFIWATNMGGSGNDQANAIVTDGNNNLFVAGYFNGAGTFGSTVLNTGGTSENGYVCKLDTAGNHIWAKSFESSSKVRNQGIAVDSIGNPLITGWFEGTVDVDPGTATVSEISAGDRDIMYVKLDDNGDLDWYRIFGSTGLDQGKSLDIDNDGNIYLAGQFNGTVDFENGVGITDLTSAGSNDAYVQKLDASGDFVWAKGFGSTAGDFVTTVKIDLYNYVVVSGVYQGTIDLDPGAGTDDHTTAGAQDIFIQKLDSAGNYIWGKSMGSAGNDQAYGSYVDFEGNIFTVGQYENTVDFDPEVGLFDLTSAGGKDIYVQKLMNSCSNPISTMETLTECVSYTWPANGQTYTADGVYTAVLTSIEGCDSTVTLDLTINTVDVGVTQNSFDLTADLVSATYQWLDCDDNNSELVGETNQTFMAATNGNYAVEVTNNGCTDTSSCHTIEGLGLFSSTGTSLIELYPNPTAGDLFIASPNNSISRISVLNALGQLQDNKIISPETDNYKLTIEGEVGVFFIKVYTTDGGMSVFKILKR